MKVIPSQYWQQNYPLDHLPTQTQRWWVQRWLELTDPETSYWHSIPLTNTPLLLKELTDWVPVVEDTFQGRTLFFLLSELLALIENDRVLKESFAPYWHELHNQVSQLVESFRTLYDPTGIYLNGKTKSDVERLIPQFGIICSHKDIRSEVKAKSTDLLNKLLQILDNEKAYLISTKHLLLTAIQNCENELELDGLTQGLLVELVVRHNYAFSYLRQKCLDFFLRPDKKATFENRFDEFLNSLIETPGQYDIYMRVQAKQIVREIGRIGPVLFAEVIPDMNRLAEDMRRRGLFTGDQERHAKEFFYGGEASDRQIFAVVSDIEAEDFGKAVVVALRFLDQAVKQAKFEFEIGDFSLDNRIYIHNKIDGKLIYFTKRQAQKSQFTTLGNSLNLERLLISLSAIENNPDVPRELKEKVSSFALHWHRTGVEATALETKFLSHWLGLEQIFTLVSKKVRGKTSAGDKLCLALTEALFHHRQRQLWLDLWGDLVRCNFFGPSPLLSLHSGRVWFNEPLSELISCLPNSDWIYLKDNEYYEHIQYGSPRPKIEIKSINDTLQTLDIKPDIVLYVQETESIHPGQWLGGMKLEENFENIAIQKLFYNQHPNLINLWYLLCSSRFQREALEDYSREFSAQGLVGAQWVVDLPEIIEVLEMFDLLERLSSDFFEGKYSGENIVDLTANSQGISNKAIQSRVQRVAEKKRLLDKHMPLYINLDRDRDCFINKHTDHEKQLINLPTSLLKELYRGHQPTESVLADVVRLYPYELAQLCEGQPLLEQRIKFYSKNYEEIIDNSFIWERRWSLSLPAPYLWEVDRIRRARNAIVHEVASLANLEILTRRLYQYSRVYLRKIIGRMASHEYTKAVVERRGKENECKIIEDILCLG